MSQADLLFEVRGPTATVTFNRPAARNAMTWDMYERLVDACERIDADDAVRVAVLRGAGGAFVAGTDITQFREFSTAEDGLAYERRIEQILDRLERVRVPTIAAVEGYAVGGGLALAASCDLRICAPSAKFGLPIARTLGNCVSMRTYARLAGHAPLTMWASKQAFRRLRDARLPDGDDLIAACYGSEDFREGVQAFTEKRPARWQGR